MTPAYVYCKKCEVLVRNSQRPQTLRCFCPLEQAAEILREGLSGPVTVWDRVAPNLAEVLDQFYRTATFMSGRDSSQVPDAALRIARTIVESEMGKG